MLGVLISCFHFTGFFNQKIECQAHIHLPLNDHSHMPENKYVCIHGHFYQPPRENAWLDTVELQEGALPFHDWNEKINFECYAPNAAARILDGQNKIKRIVNNYAQVSFNFGPTLLSWMEIADPVTYKKILDADRLSQERFGGHGNALAQVYNHLIMPLANKRDKNTQVRWGIADFEHRFKRKPEGMWLSETAVDMATLEVLAEHGLKFTILAPRQAKAFRKINGDDWMPLKESIDPRRAYLCKLDSGRSITLFFYDGSVAKDVAFQNLLNSGEAFANRLTGVFDDSDSVQLSHIATDGESYGHHHRHGEMALAWGLDHIEKQGFRLTNYGEFLEKHPPEYEVQIHENSSWSCVHGVERWRSDCGCKTGGEAHWNQAWRKPLRDALDWISGELCLIFEKEGKGLMKDVWTARDDYISLILNRRKSNTLTFIQKHQKRKLNDKEQTMMLRLLGMQHQAMLMYTSCAWFFTEISSIETDQVLQYALRGMQYARYVTHVDFRDEFEKRLEKAPSNIYENGAVSYRQNVIPAQSNLVKIGMGFAAAALFDEGNGDASFLHSWVENEVFDRYVAGVRRLVICRTTITSQLDFGKRHFSFAILYLGQQNMIGSVSLDMSRKGFDKFHQKIMDAFKRSDIGDVINLLQDFGPRRFSFKDMAKDEKRRILRMAINRNLPPVEAVIRNFYNDNYHLMTALEDSHIPMIEGWKNIVQFVVNQDLTHLFEKGKISVMKLKELVSEVNRWEVKLLDPEGLSLAIGERVFNELQNVNSTVERIIALNEILEALPQLGIQPELWKSQNLYYDLNKGYREGEWVFVSQEWKNAFLNFGRLLDFSEEWT